jgi:hypothetical protein
VARLKSVVIKKNPTKSKNANQGKGKGKKKCFDLENLSSHDISILCNKLGLIKTEDKENSQSFQSNRSGLRIEVNQQDLSENDEVDMCYDDSPIDSNKARRDLEKALFGESENSNTDDDEWDLPQNYFKVLVLTKPLQS